MSQTCKRCYRVVHRACQSETEAQDCRNSGITAQEPLGERLCRERLEKIRPNIKSLEDVGLMVDGLEKVRDEAHRMAIAQVQHDRHLSQAAVTLKLRELKASRAISRLLCIDTGGHDKGIADMEVLLARFHGPEDEREGLVA